VIFSLDLLDRFLSAGAPHQASAPPPASVLVRPQALRPTPGVRVAAGPVLTRLCCVLPRSAAGFPFICVLVLSCRRRPGFGRAEVVLGLAVQPPLETAAPPRLSLSFPPTGASCSSRPGVDISSATAGRALGFHSTQDLGYFNLLAAPSVRAIGVSFWSGAAVPAQSSGVQL
jgi:hypothetical protein